MKNIFAIVVVIICFSCKTDNDRYVRISNFPKSIIGEYLSIDDYYDENYEDEEKRKTYLKVTNEEFYFIIADSDYEGKLDLENNYGDVEVKIIDSVAKNNNGDYKFYCKEISNSSKSHIYINKVNNNFKITECNFFNDKYSKTQHGLFKRK
ncbi:hypothetical protein B0I03_10219 [Flavobacterium aquaticum]|uniref:Uncharacterized protein n=1 Tax=Flavobacterium aquaticum TaxID=1236486 RepID=A0A327YT73_9FLAO|nr:hypothetical protein [Flavobacterium aquaticum]RAK24170.1 hypothetical protein B0I03_10219 [Flavobacterium aquaticum]